ncbi:hypothetical protein BDZ91DRAFT_794941 [Kalaharituber pfeilii]|nr:hypothetical protein BDZ91DRAFT_794941 [Kalaharituber pfeilii]
MPDGTPQGSSLSPVLFLVGIALVAEKAEKQEFTRYYDIREHHVKMTKEALEKGFELDH